MRTTRFENLVLKSDTALNDSDKTFTVPAGKQWWIKSIYASLVSTATVGNRQLDVLFTDASDVPICKAVAGAVQAGGVTRAICFAPLNPQETGFTNTLMYRAIPDNLVLSAGYKVRVYDSAAIDAAADDMAVQMLVEERTE